MRRKTVTDIIRKQHCKYLDSILLATNVSTIYATFFYV